jgi:geranylgeranyl pyrophosphate synthase
MANTDFTFTGIVNIVFEKAAPYLTDDELGILETQREVGKRTVRDLAEHIEGLACLVANDEDNRAPTGSFQSGSSLFSLLLSINQTLEAAHARLELADRAQFARDQRGYAHNALPDRVKQLDTDRP